MSCEKGVQFGRIVLFLFITFISLDESLVAGYWTKRNDVAPVDEIL